MVKNISSGRIVRWEKNNRFWIKRFEGGYVLGDFVSGLSTHAFDKAENKYTKAELRKVREFIKGVICWKPNTAYQAAIACFNSWLEDKEGIGDDENHQILEHVKSFFELHAHSRFFDLDGFKNQKISNMAGYKSVYQDAVTFLYLCPFFSVKSAELEAMWNKYFDHPPEVTSRQHMTAKIAYKIQELLYGGVDAETENKIRNCSKEVTKEKTVTAKKTQKFSPMIGTKITKEHGGKIHEVLVVNDGFSYEGTVYTSLSAIATKITGTRWNGLKFFGVKK